MQGCTGVLVHRNLEPGTKPGLTDSSIERIESPAQTIVLAALEFRMCLYYGASNSTLT